MRFLFGRNLIGRLSSPLITGFLLLIFFLHILPLRCYYYLLWKGSGADKYAVKWATYIVTKQQEEQYRKRREQHLARYYVGKFK